MFFDNQKTRNDSLQYGANTEMLGGLTRHCLLRGGRCMSVIPQLSYDHGTSTSKLIGSTIGQYLDRQAKIYGDIDALIVKHQNVRLSYSDFAGLVDTVARNLLAIGILPGDRVGIWAANCYEWTLTQFATAKIGAILVTINPAYQQEELKYALNLVECKALITAPSLKTTNYLNILNTLAPELSVCGRGDLTANALPHLRSIIRLGEDITKGMMNFESLLDKSSGCDDATLTKTVKSLQFDDAINIQFTSGTTGHPKGATLTHHNILNNGFFIGETIGLKPGEKVCIPVPLYHCFGMVIGNLACLTHGCTMVYPSDVFDPESALRAVAEERCAALYGVPTMIIAQLEHPNFKKYDLSSLRTGILAGSLVPKHVMQRVQKDMHMKECTICYGMTETSPVSTQTGMHDPIDKRVATVGRVHPHVEIKIVDAEDKIVPRGETGELLTRGYSLMKGYWEDEKKTKESISPDGWMRTGDLATMDAEGYVSVVGRLKDMVIRGGENIYPKEIEEFLYSHPAVQDVAVIGVDDEKYGEELCACVILRPGFESSVSAEDIKKFGRGKIAHFKIPKYVQFVDSFPMTVSGKIKKFELRIMMKEKL